MLVPGHIVFLWRIIHQHFTLAFLKHISTCRWNKPSWPVALFGLNSKVQLEQLVPFCPFNVEVVATHLRCTFRSFGYFSRNKSRQLSPKSLLSHTSARYCNDRAFGVCLVRFYAGSPLDHLDLKPSLLPVVLPAPDPWCCHGRRRRKGSYVSSPADAWCVVTHHANILSLFHIFDVCRADCNKHGNGGSCCLSIFLYIVCFMFKLYTLT